MDNKDSSQNDCFEVIVDILILICSLHFLELNAPVAQIVVHLPLISCIIVEFTVLH